MQATKSTGNKAAASGIPLSELVADARALDDAGFAQRYAGGFLMAMSAGGSGGRDARSTQLLFGDDEVSSAHTASIAVLVHPLRPRDGSGGHLITVGREPTHDVVIADLSVSRFHALIKREPNGDFVVQDNSSTNGTTVNGRSVLARGAGPPTRLTPGDTVKFGRVDLTFADAKAVREFALQAAG